jgi:hypothetical protein
MGRRRVSDKPRLFREKCPTCVFRPGNPMRLIEGRLADLIEQNRATGSMLICHETTYGQAAVEVMCRGYWDAYADTSAVPQIMARLFGPDWYQEVSA